MSDEPSALIIGGGMGTAAVGFIIWAVKMLIQRVVDQLDKGMTEIRNNLVSLAAEVHRNTAQTTGLAAELGAIKQRVDQHDGKFDGVRESYRQEVDKVRTEISSLTSRIDGLVALVSRPKE